MTRCYIHIVLRAAATVLGALCPCYVAHAEEPLFSRASIASNWTGFYIGAFVGRIWADVDATELVSAEFGAYTFPGDPYGFDADSLVAGGQIGYDWQWSNAVTGIAGEIGFLDLHGSIEDPNSLPTGAPVTSFSGHLYLAMTGRVGIPFGRVLTFVRGGVAFLDASGSTIDTCGRSFCGQTTIDASGQDVLKGWTIGGGLEMAVTNRWRVGSEYRFYSFEDLQVSGISDPPSLYSQDLDVDFHTIRVFANYRW